MKTSMPDREHGFTLVELMVVLTIVGVIGAAVTGMVISSLRVEQEQQQLQAVIDDGRLSMERIRREVRQVRRVYESSGPDRLHMWIDRNQDSLVTPDEQVCYVVEELDPDDPREQYQISRWTHAEEAGDCAPGALPSGQSRTVVARTLVDDEPFAEYSPPPGGVTDPPTREVRIQLQLEVLGGRGPESVDVGGSIRVRNVP